MKNSTILKIVVVLLCAIFAGCKKEAVEVNSDLEGTWVSEVYNSHGGRRITFNADGSGRVEEVSPSKTYEGKAKIANNELKIGRWKTHINQYPAYDAAGNYMLDLEDAGKFYAARIPLNASASVLSSNVMFSWDYHDGDIGSKTIEYRLLPSGNWVFVSTDAANSFTVSGLSSGSYEWQMKTVNGNHSSQYTAIAVFSVQ